MEELKTIVTNYEMGFISSLEFIMQYMDILRSVGADKELFDVANNLNAPLANYLVGIVKGSGNSIWQFEVKK